MIISLILGENNYNSVKFNQYDKNYTFTIKLNNYTPKEGDVVKIEWAINKIAVIQTDDITVNGNVLTVNLLRDVTLNTGRGYFNVVVDNTIDNSRRATFKSEFEIVGNSIDEDTISAELIETTVEKLQNEELNANAVYDKLVQAKDNAELDNYLKKSGGTMTNNITFVNGKGINGTKTDGTNTTLVRTTNTNINAFGDTTTPTRILSKGNATVYDGKDRAIFHEGNGDLLLATIKPLLLELEYPIGSIKLTANNVNPSTYLGGTWEAIGQGKVLVGVGTGKDKNNRTMSFEEGSNDGEYSHTQTIEEMPRHNHPQSVTASNGSGSIQRTDYSSDSPTGAQYPQGSNTYETGEGQAFNIIQPSYGLYIWKRVN